MELFRHCPGCGRRFHVKLENVKVIRDEKKAIPTKRSLSQHTGVNTGMPSGVWMGGDRQLLRPAGAAILIEGKPIIVEEKEFEYSFKCGHCGHEWTEHQQETHKER